MYSEVMAHSSIPHSPDLVYEQEAGTGNKRVSFGSATLRRRGMGNPPPARHNTG